jgi:hypothetical protein
MQKTEAKLVSMALQALLLLLLLLLLLVPCIRRSFISRG